VALAEIGVEYTHLRGMAPEGVEAAPPSHLIVATARRAARLPKPVPNGPRPVRIAVAAEDSNALRRQLRSAGFDYLVRSPAHPAALRVLLLRALYRGPERRVAVRHPIGHPILYRTAFLRRPGTLLEISLSGCRLLANKAAEIDARIGVILGKEVTGDRALTLEGWVMRCESTGAGEWEIAVAFDALGASEGRLRETLQRAVLGASGIAAAEPDTGERRSSARGAFQGEVVELRERAARALVGRNLSAGGMLVEQNLGLRPGDETRLAIFTRSDEPPIEVRARALREDEAGLALQFLDVPPREAERLEALVAGLPPVELLSDGEAGSLGTVVAEIVGDRSRE
jgi:hypothetical protein